MISSCSRFHFQAYINGVTSWQSEEMKTLWQFQSPGCSHQMWSRCKICSGITGMKTWCGLASNGQRSCLRTIDDKVLNLFLDHEKSPAWLPGRLSWFWSICFVNGLTILKKGRDSFGPSIRIIITITNHGIGTKNSMVIDGKVVHNSFIASHFSSRTSRLLHSTFKKAVLCHDARQ